MRLNKAIIAMVAVAMIASGMILMLPGSVHPATQDKNYQPYSGPPPTKPLFAAEQNNSAYINGTEYGYSNTGSLATQTLTTNGSRQYWNYSVTFDSFTAWSSSLGLPGGEPGDAAWGWNSLGSHPIASGEVISFSMQFTFGSDSTDVYDVGIVNLWMGIGSTTASYNFQNTYNKVTSTSSAAYFTTSFSMSVSGTYQIYLGMVVTPSSGYSFNNYLPGGLMTIGNSKGTGTTGTPYAQAQSSMGTSYYYSGSLSNIYTPTMPSGSLDYNVQWSAGANSWLLFDGSQVQGPSLSGTYNTGIAVARTVQMKSGSLYLSTSTYTTQVIVGGIVKAVNATFSSGALPQQIRQGGTGYLNQFNSSIQFTIPRQATWINGASVDGKTWASTATWNVGHVLAVTNGTGVLGIQEKILINGYSQHTVSKNVLNPLTYFQWNDSGSVNSALSLIYSISDFVIAAAIVSNSNIVATPTDPTVSVYMNFTYPTIPNIWNIAYVSWGDGTESNITHAFNGGTYDSFILAHTYQLAGTYQVIADGMATFEPPNGILYGETTFGGEWNITLTYAVSFVPSGLPSGVEWWVNLSGDNISSTSSTIAYTSVSGYSYTYGTTNPWYWATGVGGTVSYGATITVGFGSIRNVTFHESGLPNGAQWNVITSGGTISGSGNLSILLKNGSYTYSTSSFDNGWKSGSGSSGKFTVADLNQTINVSYTIKQYKFALTFTETGLPANQSWSVWDGGQGSSSSTNTIIINVSAGSTFIQIQGISGYTMNPGTWSNSVESNMTIHVAFTKGTLSPLRLFGNFEVDMLLVIAIIAIVVFAAIKGRGKK